MSTTLLKPELSFHPFDGASLEHVLDLEAPPFSSPQEAFHQLRYVQRYATDVDCKCIAVERHYIDRDYMEDHSVFYSKTLHPYENFCRRIHFFALPEGELRRRLQQVVDIGLRDGESAYRNACRGLSAEAYLGFMVIKPLRGSPVGRTVLRSFPERPAKGDFRREFTCTRTYSTHLAGVELTVCGLAFQQQDVGVSACATTAIWSALQQAQNHEDVAVPTPAQITTLASKYSLPFGRAMPSEGLSIDQMCQSIHAMGFAPNLFRVENDASLARGYVYSAVRSGFAPVLVLRYDSGYHAVTVAGMKIRTPRLAVPVKVQGTNIADDRAGDLIALYIHDDRRGPYLRAELKEKNATPILSIPAREKGDREELWTITHILVPMHAKIRLSFSGLRYVALHAATTTNAYRDIVEGVKPGSIGDSLVVIEAWIARAHKYVERLLLGSEKLERSRVEHISTRLALPRYLGIVRLEAPYFDPIELLVDTTNTRRNAQCLAIIPITSESPHTKYVAELLAKACGDCPVVT